MDSLMSEEKFFASEISHSAEAAENQLLEILKTSNLRDKCYAYKSRVKTWKSLISKVEIKRKKKPEYNLEDITDVLGLRVVTLFRQDMIDVIDIILSLVTHQMPYNPIPFVKNSLKEAIIYSPSITNDNIISQADQKINSFELLSYQNIKKEPSAARYSSIHLVACMDVGVPDFKVDYKIPIEIQIRTVFEDAWGELDHKYGYQSREGKSEEIIANPLHVQKNLLTMKKFVDACSEYADNIRDLAVETQLEERTVKPLDTDELITDNLTVEGVPKNIIDDYMKVREERAAAESSSNRSQLYLNAAESFSKLLEQTLSNTSIQKESYFKTYYYYIKMDEALCRLSTSDSSETEKALIIYKELIKTYSAYPVIRFRMGQSYIRLKEFEEGRKQLKTCRRIISKLENVTLEKKRVCLPEIELKKLDVGLCILLGFAYWKEANDIYNTAPESIRVRAFLDQAFLQTQPALNIPTLTFEHKLKLINNIIFYALEIVHFKNLKGNNEKYLKFIEDNYTFIAENTQLENSQNIQQLDTLMNCYLFLDDTLKAVNVAKRIEKLSLESNIKGGSRIDKKVLTRVKDLLS